MDKKLADQLRQIGERGGLRRTATVVRSGIDEEARTVELAFSSETETVLRWFGIEVLGHGPGECDLSRLQTGAPLLWMHDWDDQRGVVESARIDADGVGRAVVRFSRSPAGDQLFQDVVDGIISKVSVGYNVGSLKLVEERDDVDVYRITAWAPYEISMCSIPADDTVGVGRTPEKPYEEKPERTAENVPADNQLPNTRTAKPMEKITRDAQGNLVRAKVNENGEIVAILEVIEEAGADARAAQARGQESERNRVRALSQLGTDYGQTERAAEFIRDGRTAEEFQNTLLADYAASRSQGTTLGEQNGGAGIGMTERDVRSYSLMRVVRALANPGDRCAQEAAAFEIECSRTAAAEYGREARGIIIPADVLGSRAFNAGGVAGAGDTGANLVGTTHAAGSFIEMLRNRTTIMQLGTVLGGLVGQVEIPKQTGGATAYWVGEEDDAEEGAPTIGQVALAPKTVAAYTDISRRLSMQSTPDAERIVVNDLNNAMRQAIDKAGFYGTGTDNQPLGLANYTGINAVAFATAGKPTHAELVEMESQISADNADVGSMAYVLNAAMRGHCKTALKFQAAGSGTIWEPGNMVNGYRAEVTNQVEGGDVFHGNFADLVIALWGGLDVTVDPYSLSKSGGLRLVAFQDVDFVLRRVESIARGRAA